MPISRLSRLDEQKQAKRLVLSLVGIIAIIALVLIFGLKALIGFSLFVEKIKGGGPTPTPQSSAVILPPTLNPPPEATNTATINVTGTGTPKLTVIVYVNAQEFNKLSVGDDGNFTVQSVPLNDGNNTISAKLTDTKGNTSDLSNVVSVTYGNKPPKLDISAPNDNSNVSGDPNSVTVTGSTDDNVSVTINDRLVVVHSDNTFSYNFPLNQGDNILKIVATDTAGNQTTVQRKVTYQH